MKSNPALQFTGIFTRVFACLILVTAAPALDVNHDGMDDLWQARYNIAPFAGALDPDGDGRVNFIEAMNMTDPLNTPNPGLGMVHITDTHPADGLDDRWQARFGITAAQALEDPDEDGRTNLEEGYVGSDPFVADVPWSHAGSTQGGGTASGPEAFTILMPWTAPGWRYTLQVSDTLMSDSWSTAAVVPGENVSQWGSGNSISVTAATGGAERKFFRWMVDSPNSDYDSLDDWAELQLGTSLLNPDSDGDGYFDDQEFEEGTDAMDAASNGKNNETDKEELPMGLFGFYKSVYNNIYFEAPPSSFVSWSDSSPQSGGEYYQGGASQLAGRLQALTYPDGEWTKLSSFGWSGVQAAATQHTWSGGSYHSLYWVKTGIATQTRGVTQPWCVSRQYLQVAVRKPYPFPPIPNVEYSGVTMRQFSVMPGQEMSDLALLEPEMEEAATKEVVLLKPEITGYDVTFDFESTIGGREQNDSVAALPGEIDHWIMLPQGTPKSVYLNGIGSHNLVYRVLGSGLSATGATVDAEGIVRAEQNHLNIVTLEGTAEGHGGVVQAGVAYGTDGSPSWAVNRPLVKVAVLPNRSFTVKLHPIALVSAAGISEPTNCPSAETLEYYLASVFGVQANVWPEVTRLDTAYVNFDVGLGINGDNYGAGNGAFEVVFNETGNDDYNNSAEENAVENASPAVGADVHVYFLGLPGLMSNGELGMFKAIISSRESGGETIIESRVRGGPVLGQAGKSPHNARGGKVYVWNYTRNGDDPTHLWSIAHEIMHYVAQVGHSDQPGADNYMPNSNPENRLMTGREGDTRKIGPKKLLKVEWKRLNEMFGFDNQNNNND